MTFIAPPNQIVFDSNPKSSTTPSHLPVTGIPGNPNCLIRLGQSLPPGRIVGMPNPFSTSPDEPVNGPITFLHQRRSRNGAARLVIIGDVLEPLFVYETCVLIDFVGQLPTPRSEMVFPGIRPLLLDAFDTDGDGIADRPYHTRIYAGQPDPADESHFTIAYEIGNKKDIIDCYLQDDGTVTFACRCGPSTRPIHLGAPVFMPPTRTLRAEPRVIGPFTGDLIDEKPRRRE